MRAPMAQLERFSSPPRLSERRTGSAGSCWHASGPCWPRRRCFVPTMPRTGKPFSVRMTQLRAARLGLRPGRAATATRPTHPVTGRPWPAMPECLLRALAGCGRLSGPARGLPRSTIMPPAPGWARIATRTRRTTRRRSCRSRWATTPPSTSVACGARRPKQRVLLRSGDVVVLGGRSAHGLSRRRPHPRPAPRPSAGGGTIEPDAARVNASRR